MKLEPCWILTFDNGRHLAETGPLSAIEKLGAAYVNSFGAVTGLHPLNLPAFAQKLGISDEGPCPDCPQEHLWVHAASGLAFQCSPQAEPLTMLQAVFSAGSRRGTRHAAKAWAALQDALRL